MTQPPPSADVSVVVPCYRSGATIARCVQSVADQTVLPREIILVDDGSPDTTGQTLAQLKERYDAGWIRIITLPKNCGVSVARNTGWDAAAGKFVAFLDADDAWHPQKIELQHRYMVSHADVAMSGHRSLTVDPDDRPPVEAFAGSPAVVMLPTASILRSNPFATPTIMVRRELECRFQGAQRFAEDFLFTMQVALSGRRIALLEAELAFIFKRPGETGASGRIWQMRRGDLRNYWILRRAGQLGFAQASVLSLFSMMKFGVMLALGPKRHYQLKAWREKRAMHRRMLPDANRRVPSR